MTKGIITLLWGAGMATMLATAGIKAVDMNTVQATPTMQESIIDTVDTDYIQMQEAQTWLAERHISVPDEIRFECEAAGASFDVCPELLMAIAWKESRFVQTAQNGSFIGLMQMHKGIHADRLSVYGTDPYAVHAQIWAAAGLLKDIAIDNAIAGEEADAGAILAVYHGEKDPHGDLSGYSKRVLEVAEKLERAHGK